MSEIPRNYKLIPRFRSNRVAEQDAQSAIDRRIKYSSRGAFGNKYEIDMLKRERRFNSFRQRRRFRDGFEPYGILIPTIPTIETVVFNHAPSEYT